MSSRRPDLILQTAIQDSGSRLLLQLRPNAATLPLSIQRHDDPLLPWVRAIHRVSSSICCGYIVHLSAFFACGGAGMVALERSIPVLRSDDKRLVILHGPFAHEDFAVGCGPLALGVHAATVISHGVANAFAATGVMPVLPEHAPAESGDSWFWHEHSDVLEAFGTMLHVAAPEVITRHTGDNFEDALAGSLRLLAEATRRRD